MPFRRKILYYGLMLLLTLLALEGMARIAYYAAYGQWYGGGGSSGPADYTPALPNPDFAEEREHWRIPHPFYGYTYPSPGNALNAMPPRPRRADTVAVGLLGGSVAKGVEPFLQSALTDWFAAHGLTRQPLVIDLTGEGMKQPQQTLIVGNNLLLGSEFDLIVNLDGFNDITVSVAQGLYEGLDPFFPIYWDRRVGLTRAENLLAGNIAVLRRERARLAAAGATSPLRRSAVFGLANRWRQERAAAEIIRLNHQLAAAKADYSLEKHGPRSWLATDAAAFAEAARFWQRSSLLLAELAELAGAEYYHFLQPNQYVPGAKPLSAEEREMAWDPGSLKKALVEQGYPLLNGFSRDLQNRGVNYFDLTRIFVDHSETLYRDPCCHLNDRGYELLAAAMTRRLEPALRHLAGESRAAPVSALAAARRPAESIPPPAAPGFQVSFQDDGKFLRYVREGCAPGDADPGFFLHIIPQEVTDLPLSGKEYGFDLRDFRFAEAGGSFEPGQCTAQIRLPDYPIAALRTGQTRPGQGDLWAVELFAATDADKLRADYAILAALQPVVRDYFDLYDLGNRLIYLRENCTAEDTAARFFQRIVPADPVDLLAERRAYGTAWLDFAFASRGGHFDGKCLASVPLPDYPISELLTGQYELGQGDLWAAELIAPPDPDRRRAEYAALSAAEPAARAVFDLYVVDNRLIYRRENCAAADTAARFFLHTYPQEVTDLPPEWRPDAAVWLDFSFASRGGHFDGKCLAAVSLPDYPLKEIRTGQYVTGQGELWSAELMVAP